MQLAELVSLPCQACLPIALRHDARSSRPGELVGRLRGDGGGREGRRSELAGLSETTVCLVMGT